MNISQCLGPGLCGLIVMPFASLSAATGLPPQDNFLETGVVILKQEAPALRLTLGWVMNLGLPSWVSRMGLELGTHFFDEAQVPDYGFFLESTLHAGASSSIYFKTAVHTLDFPDRRATADSMSTLELEPGLRWVCDKGVWTLGLGLRYRHATEKITLGSDVIDRKWLFYPGLGWAWRF